MSVLDRSELEASPLADLHTIASELSIDGYRRLRKGELIDVIIAKQGGEPAPKPARKSRAKADKAEPAAKADKDDDKDEKPARSRSRKPAAESAPEAESESSSESDDHDDDESTGGRRRRGRRGGRGRGSRAGGNGAAADAEEKPRDEQPESDESEDELVEGVVELLPNGSGFVRVSPPEPSDDDVYISSAQIKRCELVAGDKVAGPKRAPRRSERFASLVRIETINGRPASELADSVRFDDLPAAFPGDLIKLGSQDATLKAIEKLTPFGKGSRVTIVGPSRAGKTEALRRLAQALAGNDDLSLSVVLAGVRPEELSEWNGDAVPGVTPVAAVSFAASEDARHGAIEPAIDQGRRLAARGSDAVVLIDTLDGVSASLARKALAAARNIVDGGSLTVIATAAAQIGGETTVIALDAALTGQNKFPAIDVLASGTLRADLLVGDKGVKAIATARAAAAAQ